MMFLGEDCGSVWKFGLEKPLSTYSFGLFCGSFDDDKGIESNTDNRGLTCEVSKGSLRVPQRLYV